MTPILYLYFLGQSISISFNVLAIESKPFPSAYHRNIICTTGAVCPSMTNLFLLSSDFKYPNGATRPMYSPFFCFVRKADIIFLEISFAYTSFTRFLKDTTIASTPSPFTVSNSSVPETKRTFKNGNTFSI